MISSVTAYVRDVRVAYLKELLLDKSLSLREIIEKGGFLGEYNFHSFFKRCKGISPGAYRKIHAFRRDNDNL